MHKSGDDMLNRLLAAVICGAIALIAVAAPAAADTYPSKPIRLIVAFAAGGATDVNARLLAQRLTQQLGKSVIVDNKPGAAGNIGTAEAARSAPDGYTLFYTTSAIASAPSIYKNLTFDPIRDFTPVVMIASAPLLLVANNSFEAKTVKELIDYARANPNKINYGTSGAGIVLHLAGAQLSSALNLQMQAVHYRGGAPALADVMGGQIQIMFNVIIDTMPLVQANRVRALAVTSAKRSPLLPDVPSIAEATGQEGLEIGAWHGILVPKGTPQDIVNRLNAEINIAIQHPEMRQKLLASGNEPLGGSSEQFATFIKSETVRWSKVVRDLDIRVD
jgi:tripartite-type tricarboxylate transporter receptor subunit TctC